MNPFFAFAGPDSPKQVMRVQGFNGEAGLP